MATPVPSTQATSRPDDWISSEHSRLAVPSWVLSGLFHGLILACLILLSQSRGCQPGYPGEGGEDFRQIGVFLTSGDTEDEPPPTETIESTSTEAAAADAAEAPLLDGPPVELNLPSASQPVLGLGAPPSVTGSGSAAPSLPSGALTGPPPSTGTAMGGATSLFGITDAGRRFVYVLDRSGSMSDFGAIRVAKSELMSSLERLDATQQFQVIFYSNPPPLMLDPRNARSDMFRGIDTHRLEVRRQVDAITPDGGTDHVPALEMALKLNPDVIFFLTDGAGVTLSDADLARLKQRNNGGARIHCIEFGKSILGRGVKNFLQKLAEQNDGQYQYRDVTKF